MKGWSISVMMCFSFIMCCVCFSLSIFIFFIVFSAYTSLLYDTIFTLLKVPTPDSDIEAQG